MTEASSTDVHLIGLELLRSAAAAVDREEAIAAVRVAAEGWPAELVARVVA